MSRFHSQSITDLSVRRDVSQERTFSTKINASASRCSRNEGEAYEFHKTRRGKQVVNASRAPATTFEGRALIRNSGNEIYQNRYPSVEPIGPTHWRTRRKKVVFRDFHISLLPSFFFFLFFSVYFSVFGKQTPQFLEAVSLSLSFSHFSTGGSRGATGGNYRSQGGVRCRFALATVSLTFISCTWDVSVFGIRVDVSCSLRCVRAVVSRFRLCRSPS